MKLHPCPACGGRTAFEDPTKEFVTCVKCGGRFDGPDIREYTLRPSGKRPISFRGEEVTSGSSRRRPEKDNRWHDISIFETMAGTFVLLIEFHSQWEGELGRTWVESLAGPDAVGDTLERFDPVPEGIGFPPSSSYDEKRQRMAADLRIRFQDLVAELLEDLPGCEQVIP